MDNIEILEGVIIDAVRAVTGIASVSRDTCLIDADVGIFPADFLYILTLVEERVDCNITDILVNNTYDIMIVRNLAAEILKCKSAAV